MRDELMRWGFGESKEPEIVERRRRMFEVALEAMPALGQKLVEKTRVDEARAMLLRVLARRQWTPTAEDLTRIDACAEVSTLERWLEQAVTAATLADALT